MRLQQLTIIDFGVYQGKNTFDLNPVDKPIIIFGGKNGSGKTTLLEAIKLCLYGPRAINYKISRKEYEDHIRKRIHRHRGAIVPLDHTSISLSFEYSIFGKEQNYEVNRSWNVKHDNFQEHLQINMNGKPLPNVSEGHWQEYIDDLVPPSIADLFFFDGEKIQTLVIDNFNEQVFANEVKRLLGIHIIEKLQADLDTYLYRQRKENIDIELQKKLEDTEILFKVTEQKYLIKLQEVGRLKNKIENIKGHIEKQELQISRESSGYAFQRESLKSLLIKTDVELEILEKQLHEYSSGLLPFALVPELCKELKSQLETEGNFQQWHVSNNLISPKINNIQKIIRSNEFWDKFSESIPQPTRQKLKNQISEMLSRLLEPNKDFNMIKILHQISEQERFQLISWIDESIQTIPQRIKKIGVQLSILEETRQDTILKIRNIPDDEVLRPMMEELNELNQELGGLSATYDRLIQEKDTLYQERDEVNRKLKKVFENLITSKRAKERLSLIEKTQTTLNDYLAEVTKRKTLDLEKIVVNKFNLISRKPDLINRVSIDSRSFHIDLFDSENIKSPKELLSAGEKQMFAIALLWALRELSGKPFPVIIDTPLGKLDSDHRDNLVKEYFPRVSHQVILFSTDKEIDQVYFNALESQISHTYHLNYDPKSGSTSASTEYFWGRIQDAAQ